MTRVYDISLKHVLNNVGTVEIDAYHDEREGDDDGPQRWHARVVIRGEAHQVYVVNIQRDTQQNLFQALEGIKELFEDAATAVLDAA